MTNETKIYRIICDEMKGLLDTMVSDFAKNYDKKGVDCSAPHPQGHKKGLRRTTTQPGRSGRAGYAGCFCTDP